MKTVTLRDASGASAAIAIDRGFNCFAFQAVIDEETVDVLHAEEDFLEPNGRPSASGIPLLFPFPNRIKGGRFSWAGKEYELPGGAVADDGLGNAIHGFCLDRPWRVTGQTANTVTAEFQLSKDAEDRLGFWPGDCRIVVKYSLTATCLRADIQLVNESDVEIPWGFGTHAYFRVPLSSTSSPDQCLVQAPAGKTWELEDFVPTGTITPVAGDRDLRDGVYFDTIQLDDVLTDVTPESDGVVETVVMDEAAGLQVVQRFGSEYRELVAYTPPHRTAVCLEPYTCVTDAINLESRGVDAGLRTLQPGGEFHTRIDICVERIIV